MASIQERKRYDGTSTYRVRLRRNGFKPFQITFMTREEAENWVLENEEEYYENPETYHIWFKGLLMISRKVENRKL